MEGHSAVPCVWAVAQTGHVQTQRWLVYTHRVDPGNALDAQKVCRRVIYRVG
jgi:hypothetical protein